LQAVEPKCEVSVVLAEPHCGQATGAGAAARMKRTTLLARRRVSLACGGAMP
jgi:hypothetical protein